MGLFYLVQQHNGVGVTTHAFRQLSAFFVAYIARRGTNQTGDIERFGIFGHVDTNQGIC